jgi:hypothetical protein
MARSFAGPPVAGIGAVVLKVVVTAYVAGVLRTETPQ